MSKYNSVPKLSQKGIIHVVMLIILLVGLVTGLYLVKHPTVLNPHASESTTIDKYSVFEKTLNYSTTNIQNPWDNVTVAARFTSPSGKSLQVDGFYYEPNTYKVRFTPNEVGVYAYTITISGGPAGSQQQNGTFTSQNSSNPGFIRRIGSSNKLMFENGTVFNGVGMDGCWDQQEHGVTANQLQAISPLSANAFIGDSSEPAGEGGRVNIDSYFQKYQDNGFNMFRWNPGNCSFNYPWIFRTDHNGNAYFDVDAGKKADLLLSTAKAHGYHILFTFFNADQVEQETGTKTGVPYPNASENSPEGQAIKRVLRHGLARFGAYIDVWELSNETTQVCEPGANYCNQVPDSWYQFTSNYLRSVDPYRRIITNSYPRLTDSLYLDVQSPHWYGKDVLDLYNRNENASMPMIVGETGGLGPDNNGCNWSSQSASAWRIAQWTSFFSGKGLFAWNSSSSRNCNDTKGNPATLYLGSVERAYTKVRKNFTQGIDANFQASQLSSSNTSIKGYSLTSPQTVGAYFYRTPLGQTNTITTTFRLTVPFAGNASWIDPKTGNVLQNFTLTSNTHNLTTPAFTEDIALKITGSPIITPTPTPMSYTTPSPSYTSPPPITQSQDSCRISGITEGETITDARTVTVTGTRSNNSYYIQLYGSLAGSNTFELKKAQSDSFTYEISNYTSKNYDGASFLNCAVTYITDQFA